MSTTSLPAPDPLVGKLAALITHVTYYRLGGLSGARDLGGLKVDLRTGNDPAVVLGHAVTWADTLGREVEADLAYPGRYVLLYVYGVLHDGTPVQVEAAVDEPPEWLIDAASQDHPRVRINLEELRKLAAVDVDGALDHERRWGGLSPLQADGLACVVCGQSYVHDGPAHRPVGIAEGTEQAVFACLPHCHTTATRPEGDDA